MPTLPIRNAVPRLPGMITYLRASFNQLVSGALSRLADITRSDETWMESVADDLVRERMHVEEGAVSLDVSGFGKLPEALARRLARRALETAKPGRTFDLREVDALLGVIAGGPTAAESPACGRNVLAIFGSLNKEGSPYAPSTPRCHCWGLGPHRPKWV